MNSKFYKFIKMGLVVFLVATGLLLLGSLAKVPGGYRFFVVLSGSMEPAIHTGSIVVTRPSTYGIGDIITFTEEGKNNVPITHRVVETRLAAGEQLFITKGDANESQDSREVKSSEIIGKVRLDIPYIGYLIAGAKQPIGFLVLIIIPALFIAFDEGKKIIAEVKRLRIKKE